MTILRKYFLRTSHLQVPSMFNFMVMNYCKILLFVGGELQPTTITGVSSSNLPLMMLLDEVLGC
jgi:hypothetical protein